MRIRKEPCVAIVGATGAVGAEVFSILQERRFPSLNIKLFASARSAGVREINPHVHRKVSELKEDSFKGVDIAIFAAGSDVSRHFARVARNAKCVVIDNSTAFRMHDDVPLVIPEINGRDLALHNGIIANPNCTTAITLMALYPLHQAFGVKRIVAASYQSVSGIGKRGIEELDEQLVPSASSKPVVPKVFPHPIACNVFPQVDAFQSSFYTREEEKMQNEARKIMHHPTFRASVTCVRVPVYRAHSIAVSAEFEKPVSRESALFALRDKPGIRVLDDPQKSLYPTPLQATGEDDCYVGRIRRDSIFDNGISFFVCGDQLRKGAALNAVQIAEALIR